MVVIAGLHFACNSTPTNTVKPAPIPAVKQAPIPAVKRDYHNWSLAEKEAESSANKSYFIIEGKKWNLALAINTNQSYEQYLLKYPEGPHSKAARDLLSKTKTKIEPLDQKSQVGKKIENWSYIYLLINYANNNVDTELAREAIDEIYLVLGENFPSPMFNSSHPDYHFRSSIIKALKEGKPFIIAFTQKNQSEGHMSAIVQELGGMEAIINGVNLQWKGDKCTGKFWTSQKWDNLHVLPYGNSMISLNYSIPCNLLSLGLNITSNANSTSVFSFGADSGTENLLKYLK